MVEEEMSKRERELSGRGSVRGGHVREVYVHAMFIKLMKRHVPVHSLKLLENLFSGCYSYVKWYNVW